MSAEPAPLILHVIHRLATGGMENGLVNVVDGLPAGEFRHAIACIEDYTDFRHRIRRSDVEVIALERSRVGIWNVRRRIFALCRRLRPAILHTRNLAGLDALVPARLAGVPACVHGEHGWDVDNLHGRQWRPALLRRMHSPFVDRYITVSAHLARYLAQRVGIASARITHICNGVDGNRFHPASGDSAQVLPPHMRGPGVVVVGTVGRIQAVKDQATLLRAVAHAVAAAPELRGVLRVAVVGDGPLLATLREEVAALGLGDIAWLPGTADNVPDVLRAFDVFVLPSLMEGISNTILEAMATGLPVVATRVGGNVEIVRDGAWGRLFEPGDVDTLSRFIADYVRDLALRIAHGEAARAAALTTYSLSTMVRRYGETYESLLKRRTMAWA